MTKTLKKESSHNEKTIPSESFLENLRCQWPITSSHWGKKDALVISEAILLQYNIEPNDQNPYVLDNFEDFLEFGDIDRIWEVLKSSLTNGSFNVLAEGSPSWDSIIDTKKFCFWLKRKNFPLSSVFSHMIDEVSMQNKKAHPNLIYLKDIQKINFNELSLPVLKSLATNVIAQARQRADMKKKKKPLQSNAINSQCMQKFLEICSEIDGKDTSSDTIREYIQAQFK